MPQLVEPRLDWALGRVQGVWEGTGTVGGHYDTPVSQYGYVGMAVPLRRFMPQAGDGGMNQWEMLPTGYAPTGSGAGGGPVPLPRTGPDWRHRTGDDVWRKVIDVIPSGITPGLLVEAEGHKDIRWMSGRVTSQTGYKAVLRTLPEDQMIFWLCCALVRDARGSGAPLILIQW